MSKKPKMHPILERLGLSKANQGKQTTTPRDILNYLLENKQLKEEDVQTAFDSLATPYKTESANTIKENTEDQPLNYRTRHIALRFYYDGADYSGLAQNIGIETDQSVEKSLFAALKKTKFVASRAACGYSRCGRTDRGVSSAGQVVAMHLKSNIPRNATWDEAGTRLVQDEELPKHGVETIRIWVLPKNGTGPRIEKEVSEYHFDKILNNVLPPTIRILGWCPVSPEFSARFSAATRTYRYFFVHRSDMNLTKMREALQFLKGKHDFRNFCKMDVEKVYNFERIIHDAQLISIEHKICYFQFFGQAFLWHQIRCIVSILFMIGRGHEEPSIISELLDIEHNPGKPSYQLAPERPLVLHHCGFNDLRLGHSTQNLWATSCELERQWEELVLAAARIRNCINSMNQMDIVHRDLVQFARVKLQERFKKQQKHKPTKVKLEKMLATLEDDFESISSENVSPLLISWEKAILWLSDKGLIPSPGSQRESVHIPLLQRHKGTTYEEKIDALSHSKRRHARYDENVVKKRKTKEEDSAFYDRMSKQGGSAI